jgi:hypothetical protein
MPKTSNSRNSIAVQHKAFSYPFESIAFESLQYVYRVQSDFGDINVLDPRWSFVGIDQLPAIQFSFGIP